MCYCSYALNIFSNDSCSGAFWLSKIQERMDNRCTGPSILGSFDPKISIFEGKTELDYLHLAPKRFEIIRRPF